jgi:isoleucyl-tRNA synthetase
MPRDAALVAGMDRVRQVASAALALRKARGLRVRLPLRSLVVAATDADLLEPFTDILADEVNVRSVELSADVARYGRFELTVNARACGPRLGGDVQKVIRAVKAGEWEQDESGRVTAAGIELLEGEYSERLVPGSALSEESATAALPGGLVVLDTEVTPELAAEGLAKDVVRLVQQARREAGLDVSDRITVTLDSAPGVLDAVRAHQEFLASEVLATDVSLAAVADPTLVGTVTGGDEVRVLVAAV